MELGLGQAGRMQIMLEALLKVVKGLKIRRETMPRGKLPS